MTSTSTDVIDSLNISLAEKYNESDIIEEDFSSKKQNLQGLSGNTGDTTMLTSGQ